MSPCVSQRHLGRHEERHSKRHPDEFAGWFDVEGNSRAGRGSQDHKDQPTAPEKRHYCFPTHSHRTVRPRWLGKRNDLVNLPDSKSDARCAECIVDCEGLYDAGTMATEPADDLGMRARAELPNSAVSGPKEVTVPQASIRQCTQRVWPAPRDPSDYQERVSAAKVVRACSQWQSLINRLRQAATHPEA